MDRIVKIETVGELAIATDEAGRQFVSPAGRWDWRPVGFKDQRGPQIPPPVEPPPVEPRRFPFSGGRSRRRS